MIVAVADGHGSHLSARSETGARFAVEAAIETGRVFLDNLQAPKPFGLSVLKGLAEEQMPKLIVQAWRQKVDDDLERDPHPVNYWDNLQEIGGMSARRAADNNAYLAYGSTLLTVLITELFIACLQLGDGDILFVSEKDEVSRPVPGDAKLFANETTSLSFKDLGTGARPRMSAHEAWHDFRCHFQPTSSATPTLIMLSTDGYSNSFRDDTGFFQVGKDLRKTIRSSGLEEVEKDLPGWLSETSRLGSGDDVTVGVIYRADV